MGVSSNYILRPNLAYLALGTLLYPDPSIFFNKVSAMVSAVHKLFAGMRSNVQLTQHACMIGVSSANFSSCSMEKWMTSGMLMPQKSKVYEMNAAVLQSIAFLSK